MHENPPDRLTDATLPALRALVETVSSPDGAYRVRCARCGVVRPPVDGCSFRTRKGASAALRVASAYRARLRQWDRRTPSHALLVEERPRPGTVGSNPTGEPSAHRLEVGACDPVRSIGTAPPLDETPNDRL